MGTKDMVPADGVGCMENSDGEPPIKLYADGSSDLDICDEPGKWRARNHDRIYWELKDHSDKPGFACCRCMGRNSLKRILEGRITCTQCTPPDLYDPHIT